MTKKRTRDASDSDNDVQPPKYAKVEDITRVENIKQLMDDSPEITAKDIHFMYSNQMAFKSETGMALPNFLCDQIGFMKLDENQENYIQLYNQAVDDFTGALVISLTQKNEIVNCCSLTRQCVENCIKSYQLFHRQCASSSLIETLNLKEYYRILENGPLVYPHPFLLQAFNILKQLQQLLFPNLDIL